MANTSDGAWAFPRLPIAGNTTSVTGPWRAYARSACLTGTPNLPLFAYTKVLRATLREAVIATATARSSSSPAAGLAEMDGPRRRGLLQFSVEQVNSSVRFGADPQRGIMPGLLPRNRRPATPDLPPQLQHRPDLSAVQPGLAGWKPHADDHPAGQPGRHWTYGRPTRPCAQRYPHGQRSMRALEGNTTARPPELRSTAANLSAQLSDMHSMLTRQWTVGGSRRATGDQAWAPVSANSCAATANA